jgi:hypothetical protein
MTFFEQEHVFYKQSVDGDSLPVHALLVLRQ